jgi:hypothetical protein
MLHEIEGVQEERARVASRPEISPDVPVLTSVEVRPIGDPAAYAARLREVFATVFDIAAEADFDDDEIPVDTIPEWFLRARDGMAADFAVQGRERYREVTGKEGWRLQDWMSRFDPELEARGWAFWDLTPSRDDRGRLHLWLDTWGEPFFSWEELRWLLYACGAVSVDDPIVVKQESWAGELSV